MPERCRWEKRTYLLGAFLSVLLTVAASDSVLGVAILGQGDFDFYLDIASIPSSSGGAIQLIQIAVPTKEIRYLEQGGAFRADIRLTLDLKSENRSLVRKAVRLRDSRSQLPKVADLSSFLCYVDSIEVAPGKYSLSIVVEDMGRRKMTLIGLLRGKHAESTVKDAVVEVKAPAPESLMLAEPVLVWSIGRDRSVIPNPMQIYGLRRDTLVALVSALIPVTCRADSIAIRVGISKVAGDFIDELRATVPIINRKAEFTVSFDLVTYGAGEYRLEVEAETGDGLAAVSGKDFTVAWELVNWQRSARDLYTEARFVLDAEEYDRFKDLSLGEQEAMLKKAWQKLDPTPETSINENYQKFLERVRYANAQYGTFERGVVSDRGNIYVRFGPPDEIVVRPVPKDQSELVSGMEKIGNEYEIVLEGSLGDTDQKIKDLRPRIVSPERQRAARGNVGGDTGSFEIWSYNFKGDPIFPGDRMMTVKSGLRFLFLDSEGYGNYRLMGTSEDMYLGQ